MRATGYCLGLLAALQACREPQPRAPVIANTAPNPGLTQEPSERSQEERRTADAEAARRADEEARAKAVEQSKLTDAAQRREKLRVDCAASRAWRSSAPKASAEAAAKQAQERAARQKLADYMKKNCKRSSRGVETTGNGVEWDEDGYLRQTSGMAVEVVFECPANGPPGARGTVSVGTRSSGRGGDPSRIARLPGGKGPLWEERNEECKEADAEADATAPK